jgi:hypothetical protein
VKSNSQYFFLLREVPRLNCSVVLRWKKQEKRREIQNKNFCLFIQGKVKNLSLTKVCVVAFISWHRCFELISEPMARDLKKHARSKIRHFWDNQQPLTCNRESKRLSPHFLGRSNRPQLVSPIPRRVVVAVEGKFKGSRP